MASGKRASMREGPLAALFRRTDEDEPEARPSARRGARPRDRRRGAARRRPRRPRPAAQPRAPRAAAAGDAAPPRAAASPTRSATRARPRAAAAPRETGYPHPSLGADARAPVETSSRAPPTPQERLRHAFSSDMPEDILAARRRDAPDAATPAPRRPAAPRSDEPRPPWGQAQRRSASP